MGALGPGPLARGLKHGRRRIPRVRALVLLVCAALTGCLAPPGPTLVLDAHAVAPAELLARLDAHLPGFEEAFNQSQSGDFEHLLAGHARLLERDEGTAERRVSVGALLFASPQHAEEAFRRLTRGPSGLTPFTPAEAGDEAMRERGAHRGGGSDMVIARADAYVLWVAEDATGAPASLDALALARVMVEQSGARA